MQKGETALSLHDGVAAMESFDKALELDPTNGPAAFDRAKMLMKVGEQRAAIADFTIAIIGDPKNAAAFDGRGEAKMKLPEPDTSGAFEDFQSGINLPLTGLEPLLVRASYYLQVGNVAAAVKDMENARKLADPQTADAITKMLDKFN